MKRSNKSDLNEVLDVGREDGERDVDVGQESSVLLLSPADLALADFGAVDLAERGILRLKKVLLTNLSLIFSSLKFYSKPTLISK